MILYDGELRLAFQQIANVRNQLEQEGYAGHLSDLIDKLQAQEQAAREAYMRALGNRHA